LAAIQARTRDGEGKVIEENIPGITPYMFSNSTGYGVGSVFCLTEDAKSDVNFPGMRVPLLPAATNTGAELTTDGAKLYFVNNVPISRQYLELGGGTVGASEYTVWETISPLAFLAGVLMGTGFQPDNWKARVPKRNRYELGGYMFLP
jgi:hypothetical protein